MKGVVENLLKLVLVKLVPVKMGMEKRRNSGNSNTINIRNHFDIYIFYDKLPKV